MDMVTVSMQCHGSCISGHEGCVSDMNTVLVTQLGYASDTMTVLVTQLDHVNDTITVLVIYGQI